MNFLESPTAFIIVAVAYWAARGFDMYSSTSTAWYYGLKESNKLSRNKDGEFDLKKNILLTGGWFLLSSVIGFATHNWGAGYALLVLGVPASLMLAYSNFHKAKKNRAKQIAFLSRLRADPEGLHDFSEAGPYIIRNGKGFFQLFHWLWLPEANMMQPQQMGEVSAKIVNLATRVPEGQWFDGH
jgi:hypothetical protein